MIGPISLKLQYEKAKSRAPEGPLAGFAEEAYRLARTNPLAIQNALCGQASKVANGVLHSNGHEVSGEPIRLKGIFYGVEALVRSSYDDLGRLASIKYPDDQVSLGYGQSLEPERIVVGSRFRVERRWDEIGHLVEVRQTSSPESGGLGKLVLERTADGAIRRVTTDLDDLRWTAKDAAQVVIELEDGTVMRGEKASDGTGSTGRFEIHTPGCEFRVTAGCSEIKTSVCPRHKAKYVFSQFGVMRLNADGHVTFWLQPDGNPMWFARDGDGKTIQVWTLQGVNIIDHQPNEGFALLSASGRRTLLHQTLKEAFFLIGPDAVSLGRRDEQGRTLSLQGMWGDCSQWHYGGVKLSGLPTTVASPQWGKIEMGYDGSRLITISVSGAGRIRLKYGLDESLSHVSVEGHSARGILAAVRVAGYLYCLQSGGESSFKSSILWSQYIT